VLIVSDISVVTEISVLSKQGGLTTKAISLKVAKRKKHCHNDGTERQKNQSVRMSTLKTPRQKKLASLALDRRNVYGRNDKASRKLIPRRKQASQQALRRAAKQPLLNAELLVDEDSANRADFEVQNVVFGAKTKAFKKVPDAPLGAVMKAQIASRSGKRFAILAGLLDQKKLKIDRS
jgi:hypothetical protein